MTPQTHVPEPSHAGSQAGARPPSSAVNSSARGPHARGEEQTYFLPGSLSIEKLQLILHLTFYTSECITLVIYDGSQQR